MGLRTLGQYHAALRDGRIVYWDGEEIADITTHPKFKVPLGVAARDFDYDNPARRDLLTYRDDDGELANRIFQVPRTEEDLQKRVELSRGLSIVGAVSSVYMALLSVKDRLAAVNPEFAANIERMWKHARDHDLRAAEVITDAKGDRSRKAHEQDDKDLYVRIVERRKDGIVVRGAKLHITAAALVDELVVMPTKAMRQDEADYAVAFSIPVATPGVKIINRSFAEPDLNTFDYPASAHHSIPEGFVIFDDVFVPWDRVFLAGESQLAGAFAQALGLWERTGGVIDALEKAELFVGLGALVVEHQGKDRDAVVQNAIAELVCYAKTIEMGLDYALRHFERTPSGMIHPNVLAINTTKYYFAANYHQMIRIVQDLGGGLTLTLPKEADLRHPVAGAYLRKYLHSKPGLDVETRMRVFNLLRDMTADTYGGWSQVVALQAGGGLVAQRIMMNRTYDLAAAKVKALRAAGALKGH